MRGRLALAILAATAVSVVVFSLFPDLDLGVARALHRSDGLFVGQNSYPFNWLHQTAVPWMVKLCLAFFGLALLAQLLGRSIAGISRSEALFVIAVFALGPGLLANTLAKDHSGRPRPTDSQPFGGPFAYAAPLAFNGACPNNCSFVSGDAAAGFAFLGPAAILPPALAQAWFRRRTGARRRHWPHADAARRAFPRRRHLRRASGRGHDPGTPLGHVPGRRASPRRTG